MYYPTLIECEKLKNHYNLVPVYREILADLDTPVSAFLKVSRGGYSFLLESVQGSERMARYSFIGTEPYRTVSSQKSDTADPLRIIAEELNQYRPFATNDLPQFCGGAVGYLGYETMRHFEKLPSPAADALHLPESLFMFVDTILAFDHLTHKIKVISHVRLDANLDNNYDAAAQKIDRLVRRLEQPLETDQHRAHKDKSTSHTTVSSNYARAEFESDVEKARQYISAGEAIQVVLSQRFTRSTSAKSFNIYRALRSINPSPYMFFLDLQDFQIIGTSPEILVKVADGVVTTRPLAGTRPRGRSQAEDAQLEVELRNDEKERAEHIMLVDLGRNDIGRVSVPGTVKVSDLMDVERYSHVMHLVTNVEGKLRSNLTSFDALRACFPAGTVSGAPKIRAMQIIAELEPDRRGPYAGCLGYFSFSGNMDTAITIRTIVKSGEKAHIQAGAGIVYDSIPAREYDETFNKAKALIKAIEDAETMETLRSHS